MSRPALPLFLDLDGRLAFLLGDGEAAGRRLATLQACGAVVRHEAERFGSDMLDGCCIAIGAEAPDAALAAMTDEARRRGIPYNVVDRPSLSGFSTPAVVSRRRCRSRSRPAARHRCCPACCAPASRAWCRRRSAVWRRLAGDAAAGDPRPPARRAAPATPAGSPCSAAGSPTSMLAGRDRRGGRRCLSRRPARPRRSEAASAGARHRLPGRSRSRRAGPGHAARTAPARRG